MDSKKLFISSVVLMGAITAISLRSSPSGASPATAPADKVDKTDIEQTHMIAPVFLSLEQGPVVGDEQTIVATIQLNDIVRYPVSLGATAPAGGAIVEGQANEVLDLSTVPAGTRLARTFRVRGISPDAPFRVTLGGSSAHNVLGFRAEKQFPPAPESIATPKYGGPRPFGGRPPAATPLKK